MWELWEVIEALLTIIESTAGILQNWEMPSSEYWPSFIESSIWIDK